MDIKLYALGGSDESGKNMFAFEIDEDIIICDMGFSLTQLVQYNDEMGKMSVQDMIDKGIIADPKLIEKKKDKVKAIIVSHAHLDHVGGVQYLASKFSAPIYATPFTIEVLKVLMKSTRDMKEPLRNKFIKVNVNSKITLPSGLVIEFVNVTHSTPQAAIIVMRKGDEAVVYSNDFKFDNRPALGQKTNYEKLREIGETMNVKLLVIDSLKSNTTRSTLSEIVVKEMLRDVFISTTVSRTKGLIVTTFASHITRIKSIFELCEEIGRKMVCIGRSLGKYSKAAKNSAIIDFKAKGVEIGESKYEVNKILKKVQQNKEKYVVLSTGHQGEERAVLSRIVDGNTPYELEEEDMVVFSSEVIPVEKNIEESEILSAKLEKTNCKVVRDVHVSGHAPIEDLKDMLDMLKPKVVVPVHGDDNLKAGMIEMCQERGFVRDKTLFSVPNQVVIDIKNENSKVEGEIVKE